MKKQSQFTLDFLSRYFLLILVAIPNLWLFYFIFTPLTIYPLYFLFNAFFDVSLFGNVITIGCMPLVIIESCIAGAAYYLLLILNLSTPKIKISKRLRMISLAFVSLLVINIFRIFFLGILSLYDSSWFDLTHKFFWYFLSIFFVVGIWFIEVKLFKIKEIPFYSDFMFLYKNIKKNPSKSMKKKRLMRRFLGDDLQKNEASAYTSRAQDPKLWSVGTKKKSKK